MGATVQLERIPGRPHTIIKQEVDVARPLILGLL